MEKQRKFIDGSLLIKEDESKATINTKHFIANNGTEKVIVSSEALHFYDENKKKWRNIDNSLEDAEGGYSARFGKYKAKLSDGETTERVEVIGDTNAFIWEYLGTRRPDKLDVRDHAHRKKTSKAKIESRVPGKFGGASSKVVYENSEGNVDLEYIVKANSIKENILVKEKADVYKYYYALNAEGFNIKLSENNRCIELYAKDNDSADSTPEFVIPEPYMFDANGVSSNNVFYELEEYQAGLYLFSVEADAAWINARERVLPVTIDPQFVEYEVSNANKIISATSHTTTYYYQSNTYDSCGNTMATNKTSSTGIRINKNQNTETYCELKVRCANVPIANSEKVYSAKLILTPKTLPLSNAFSITGAKGCINENKYEIDITEHVNSGSDLTLKLNPTSECNIEFAYSGTNAPYILLEYELNDANNTKKHIVPLIDNIIGEYNLFTDEFVVGFEDIADPILGIGISHLYKETNIDYHCGEDFRLNINETLKKLTNSTPDEMYEYTDSMGMSHKFKERFYYVDDKNNKIYIDDANDKNNLHVDASGMLWYDVYSSGVSKSHKAYRELYTIGGMMASSNIENVKNCEWLEQRSEEQKNLGDQINSYVNAILNFVAVDSMDGEIVDEIRYINEAQGFIEKNNCILTKNEAIQFRQRHIDRYGIDPQSDEYEQMGRIIAYYTDSFDINLANLKMYYKEYLSLTYQQKSLRKHMPVAYLISDTFTKGFNADGELVVIYDKYGNYSAIEREEYTSSGASRVFAIVNQDNCKTSFEYNADSKIIRITNSIGEYVSYTYDANKLSLIERSDGSKYSIGYSGHNIVSISSNTHKVCLTYKDNVFEKATVHSLVENVSNGDSTACNKKISETILTSSSGEIRFNGTALPIEYKEFRNEHNEKIRYMFSYGVDYMGCCKIVNDIIVGYTKEDHKAYSHYRKETAKPKHLNCLSFETFDFGANTVREEIKYNAFNDPIEKIVDWTEISHGTSRRTETYYTYDTNRRVIKTDTHILTKIEDNDQPKIVEITKYFYNHAGDVIRTETYIDGEEFISGVEIEENVYNDKGVKVKSFTYNSLDSTSKFYSEYDIDDKGKVLAEYDSTGEHKTLFEYEADGVTTKSSVLPNGSKFAYGRDHSGEVTAISHSTDAGESNSTEKFYTHGLLTLVKSGNNVTEYTYDVKGRVTAVKLNGVDNYITYEYSGDGTDEETTVATMIDGTVYTVVKDRLGNVVESSCNSATVSNTYNKWNKIATSETSDGEILTTEFDNFGNITSVAENDVVKETYAYNSYGKISNKTVHGIAYGYAYKDTSVRELDSISVGDITAKPKLDVNGRNVGKSIEVSGERRCEELISYVKFGDHATMFPSTVRYGEVRNGTYSIKDYIKYKYDSMGNICEVLENGLIVAKYEYDMLGRLIREDNLKFARTSIYTYDNNGNILSRFEYNLTNVQTDELKLTIPREMFVYEYDGDNTDKLICYAGAGFTYDSIGNPTTYRGRAVTWINGRQLASYDGNTYTYDARGRRTSKKNGNNTTINFTYDSNGNLVSQSNGLEFLYDHTGVFAVIFNGATYFYRKNAQGDIIAILDNEGRVVVKYTYDAWGKTVTEVLDCNASVIAELNPFRYRGYYYDIETELYFLKSRYYDPELGRFMTVDDVSYLDPDTINGLNLYAYCGNNPVNKHDPAGYIAISLLIALGIGAILGGIYGGVSAAANEQNVVLGFAIGAVTGALTGLITEIATVPMMLIGTFAVGALGDITSQMLLDKKPIEDVNLASATIAGIANAGLALVGKGLSRLDSLAGLSPIESVIFGTITNSPLLALGMTFNMIISQHAPLMTPKSIYQNILYTIN